VYDDITDVQDITSFPLSHWHRDVDKIVLDASKGDTENASRIKTAIICPPFIYGTGTGPIRNRSVQLPELALASLSYGKSFTVNDGQNVWHHVHVSDLADAYVLLIEDALSDGPDSMTWGPEAYYFVEGGQHVSKFASSACNFSNPAFFTLNLVMPFLEAF
jgi:nucleoside-diphosphate-sugar epimerase